MDFKSKISDIEKKIGYVFRDKSLLIQAFTRESFCNEKNYGGKNNYKSNEVLEFFGDSVLSTAIVSLLFSEKTKRYEHGITTELDEGDFSNIRSKLSDKKNLSGRTKELGLEKYLLVGEGDAKLGIANEASVMEDLFESIVGAVYIDCDMDMKRTIGVVSRMLDVSVYLTPREPVAQSSKNSLQEWCADKKRRLPQPVYKTVSESGPDHKRIYERACYIGEKLYSVGRGKNLKLADSEAAQIALAALMREEAASRPADDSLMRLRAIAKERKGSAPEFRDLGETLGSNEHSREYAIECRALGKLAIGEGKSKSEAREAAASKILGEIEKERKVAKTAKKVNKSLQNKVKTRKAASPTKKKRVEKVASN